MIDVERRKHEEALERVSEIKPRIIQIKENNAEFERNVKAQKDWEDLLRSFDQSLPRNILDKYELEDGLQNLQSKLQEAKRQLAENAAENERRTKLNTRIQVIQEQTAEFVEQQEEYDGKLAGNQKLESELGHSQEVL